MTDLTAPITAVTVYADRALVTRRGSINLAAGEHELLVNNLPLFTRDSLRAAGNGPRGTRILNVDITTAFHSRPPEAELQRLQDELEGLRQQQQLLKARQDALNDRRQWLRALGEQSRDFARGLARGQMKPQDCAEFFSFMAEQSRQDAEAAQDVEQQMRQQQLEIDAKKRELDRRQGNPYPDRQAATIVVELAEAGDFEVELSYLVRGASWHPQYDVRVEMNDDQSKGQVELTYIGMVQQTTGEAWENVELALSTARPSLAAVLPDLKPWYLNPYTPRVAPMAAASMSRMRAEKAPSMHRMGEVGEGEATMDYMMQEQAMEETSVFASAPAPIPADIATTTLEHTGTALVFRAGRSVDIPSDNSPHKTTIARDNLPCTFDYVSAPTMEENAHLRATITNTTERVLLEGAASIFLSGEYVGTTRIKMTAPNEEFTIFLGIDDSIKIKREPTERAVDKGNLLQNDLRRNTYAYLITVHNYANHPNKIVIRDHLPVPQHERIKVKVQHVQPQPSERTKLELLNWEFTLPPDGEQKIEYRFVVEYPQGMNIQGLPPVK